jgi:hypothetical protein
MQFSPTSCYLALQIKMQCTVALCVIKQQPMKTYAGEDVRFRSRTLDTKWRWVVCFTPGPIYPESKLTTFTPKHRIELPAKNAKVYGSRLESVAQKNPQHFSQMTFKQYEQYTRIIWKLILFS